MNFHDLWVAHDPQGFGVRAGVSCAIRSYTTLSFAGRCSTPPCSLRAVHSSKQFLGRQLATATVPSVVAVTQLPCAQTQKSGYQWGFVSLTSPLPDASSQLTARRVRRMRALGKNYWCIFSTVVWLIWASFSMLSCKEKGQKVIWEKYLMFCFAFQLF